MSDDPSTLVAQARAFDALGKADDAERTFKLAVAAAAHYPTAFNYYAEWLVIQSRFADALAMANRALQIDPRNIPARHTLMEIYSSSSNWQDVKRIAEDTLRLDPYDSAALNARQVAQSVFDDVVKAEKKASAANTVDDYLALSVAYFKTRRFEDSISACKKALAANPELPEAYSNMAAAQYQLGRLDETEASLRQALRLRPNLEVAQKNLSFILSVRNQTPPAAR
jgi:tetratricopeptide (TPR) repeat protein